MAEEQLDWGNEEEEGRMSADNYRKADYGRGGDFDDPEDAVSLGGEDDDDGLPYPYQSRSQEDFPRFSGSTPKTPIASNHAHAASQSSLESQITLSGGSQKPPQPQGSAQGSPLRSHSLPKLTHALPPKPVAVKVPYLHHSDPSIIEATAMSRGRADREKKTNGGASKPPLSNDTDPLPPDWEIRHSRSGAGDIYYYNTRTHVCQWTKPTSSDQENPKPSESQSATQMSESTTTKASDNKDNSRPARSDVDSPLPVLSYQDRHYRPGGDVVRTGIDSYRPDDRSHRASAVQTPRSFTPPPSPKPERPRSPARARDLDHRPPSRSQPARYDSTGNDSYTKSHDREGAGSQARFSASHWEPSRDSPPHTSRQSGFSQTAQSQVASHQNLESSTFRGPRGDADMPSTTRHRSPPPHMRRPPPPPPAPQLSASAPEATIQTVQPRHKSRFDQSNDSYRPSSNTRDGDHDDFPVPVSRRRDQPVHTNAERNRVDNDGLLSDDFVPNDSAGRRSSLNDRHRPPTSHSDRPVSPSTAMPLEQSHSRQRLQLVVHGAADAQERRSPGPPSSVSYRERESGSHTQGASYASGVPSGPRSHLPPITPRESKHSDFPQNMRAPPSGPSRGPRDQFYPNESPALRDRDVTTVVDNLPPSRAPFRANDTHLRPGTGMYADREQGSDLPKGPRAMSSAKTPTSTTYQAHQVSPTSPTVFVERNTALRDRPTAIFRERSPPPPNNSEGWERQRDAPGRVARSDNPTTREEPAAWRPNSRWDDPGVRRGRPEPEPEPSQAQPPSFSNRRPADNYRSVEPPPPPTAKTYPQNDTHASSRVASNHSGHSPEVPFSNAMIARQPPANVGGRDTRLDYQPRESFEAPLRYPARVSPEDMYRNAPNKSAPAPYRRPENESVDPERHHSVTANTYHSTPSFSRRDSARMDSDPVRFEQPPLDKDQYAAPRIWTPRQPSPGPAPIRNRSKEYRPPSPPQPAVTSPTWDVPFRSSNRTDGRHQPIPSRQAFEEPTRQAAMDVEERQQRPEPLSDRVRGRYPEPPITEHPKAVNDLERRLNDRYDDRYETSYQHHPSSTPNPPPRRDRETYPDDVPRHSDHHHNRPQAYSSERRSPAWTEAERRPDLRPSVPEPQYVERGRAFEGGKRSVSPPPPPPPDSSATNRKPRIRRFGPPIQPLPEPGIDDVQPNDTTRPIDRHLDDDSRRSQAVYDRGQVVNIRRGTSLLDRLSSADGTGVADAMASASLRERVLIPAKRDREEMMSGPLSIDIAFESEDAGDGRRARRRTGKPRRRRNGGN